MPLTPSQQAIITGSKRFTVASCGRRFGKTTIAVRQICYEARIPNREIYYVSPSYRMSKTIVFKKLQNKLVDLRWVKDINRTDLSFILKNNSTISLKGADNYDSLRGVGLDFLVMDEAADIDPEAFYEVLRPALSDREGRALILGTPKGFNWFKDVFDLALEYPDEWASFQFTTLDGGQVSPEEIEAARRTLDTRVWRQEYCASFENFSGRIWYAFERSHNVVPYNRPRPRTIHIGVDFNVANLCAVVAERIQSKEQDYLHIFDEIMLISSNTDELVTEIRNRYPDHDIVCYPDPAGSARKTSAGGRTDHTILRNANFRVQAPHSHNAVKDGINAGNSLICNSLGQRRLFVDPKCSNLIKSLEQHCYKEGSEAIPDKDSGLDHFSDSFRYLVDFLYPIKRNTEPIKPQMWSHRIARH